MITETKDENGNLKKGINFELLKQELSSDVVEYGEECYDFSWIGKKESIVEGKLNSLFARLYALTLMKVQTLKTQAEMG